MDWFFMVGEALGADDLRQARAYLVRASALAGVSPPASVEHVRGWAAVADVIKRPGWDARFAVAEERERRRLRDAVIARLGEGPALERLSQVMDAAATDVHGAAAVAAGRSRAGDPGVIGAAAGAAAEAIYLAELVTLAGGDADHAFVHRRDLFAAGHWPLGVVDGAFLIF